MQLDTQVGHVAAAIKLTSNGDNAKTIKVSVVANSGRVAYVGYECVPTIFDFSGMTCKGKIPMDYEHDQTIGWLSNFDTSSGALVCSGYIVLADIGGVDVNAIVEQLQAGVPYEASIQAWPDADVLIEYVPEGVATTVNGQNAVGPVYIVRSWTLAAVAICKFGADSDTSVSVQLSHEKSVEQKKGFYVTLSNNKRGMKMSKDDDTNKVEAAAVEAPVIDQATPVETPVVEAVEAAPEVQAEVVETVTPEVVEPEAVEVVEETAVEAAPENAPVVVQASRTVEAIDPVMTLANTYKAYKAKFGDKAGDYIEQGLTLAQASDKYMSYLSVALADANKRLSQVGRGGKEPIKFSDAEKRETMKASNKPGSHVRIAGKKYDN